MEQIPSYNLLQAIDPTKIKVPISERFAKLTLSSNKKQQQKCNEPDQEKEQKMLQKKRESVTRNISKQFEEETQHKQQQQNPLLRSESSKETGANNSVNADADDLTMEPLEISEDADEVNVEKVENEMELLSQQIASLVVEPKAISLTSGSTASLSINTDLVTSESQPSSINDGNNVHIVHHIPINVREAVNQDTIPLNLNSTNDHIEISYELTEDEEEDEYEVITISDTSGSHHETEDDIMATSSLPSISRTSAILSLPSLVADKAERVAAFLRDVSVERRAMNEHGKLVVNDTIDRILDNKEMDQIQEALAKSRQIATADTESLTPDIDDEVYPKTLYEREKRLKALEALEYKGINDDNQDINKENDGMVQNHNLQKTEALNKKNVRRLANDETLDNTVNTEKDTFFDAEQTPKVADNHEETHEDSNPETPKTCTRDIYRIANDETQCNTEFTNSEETPKVFVKRNHNLENSRLLVNLNADNSNLSLKDNVISSNSNNRMEDPNRLAKENTVPNSKASYTSDELVQQSINRNHFPNYKTPEKVMKNHSLISTHTTPESGHKQNSYNSLINSSTELNSSEAPEASITISETEDEIVEEKSPPKSENSNQQKLSNSFHRDDTSDDSEYDEQISKIQMSMASINISAKINIKIHIPNVSSSEASEDERNSEADVQANGNRSHSHEVKENSKEETLFHNDRSVENNEQSLESETNTNESSEPKVQDNETERNKSQKTSFVERNNSQAEITSGNEQSFTSTDRDIESASALTPCNHKQIKTFKDAIVSSPNGSSESAEIVEDEKFLTEAEKLLTQLYGNAWQTPDVIRTLKRAGQSSEKQQNTSISSSRKKKDDANSKENKTHNKSTVEESVLDDFSIFRRNIVKTNLDSTRLATPKSAIPQKKQMFTEPRNKVTPLMKKPNSPPLPQTERKVNGQSVGKVIINKRYRNNERWRQIIDDYSNPEGDSASDDDDADASWSRNASEIDLGSSDSDFDSSPKAKARKQTKKKPARQGRSDKSDYLTKVLNKSKNGEIVYLDLSKEEVEVQENVPASPPANHDDTFASRLQDILKSCRHENKPKLSSSNKKSKRKLFTPNFGDDDFEIDTSTENEKNAKEKANKRNDFDGILEDTGNCPFDHQGRPKVFELVNKQLESVKAGKPIFQLTPSPKKKGTASEKMLRGDSGSSTKAKTSDAVTFKTPLTAKSKGPTTALKDLGQTPQYKYSFLKSLDVTVSKALCHPDALPYRDSYRTKKEELSQILYDIYNEKLFGNKLEVPLQWNKKLLNTAGRCLNKKKLGVRSSAIELSEKVLTSADRLRCTLIHELCHAATWVFSGEGGHGSTWKEWARRANITFPELPKIGVCHQYDIEYKYTYKCTLCAAKSHAHSKSKKVENIRCSYCHGAIEVYLNKKDKDGTVIPTPVKEPTGFAKFVKENYKKFKRDDLKHADVMKLLSSEFASLKVSTN